MSTKNRAKTALHLEPKSIADHLGELRGRLTWVVLTLIAMSALAYSVHETLVSLVLSPIGDQQLVYLTPGGGFTFIFQIVLYAGMLLTAPFAVYHTYRFIAPALPSSLQRMSVKLVVMSTILMAAGAGFGYFIAVPAALQFLMAFAGDFVQANLTADSYLNFVVAYVIGLGLLFQLPLLLLLWNWISPIKPGGLLDSQRFVIVGAFIAAALLTPTPDVFNQSLLAVPIILVYQLGVISVYMTNRRARRRRTKHAVSFPVNRPAKVVPFDPAIFEPVPVLRPQPVVVTVTPPVVVRAQVPSSPVLQPVAKTTIRPATAPVDGFARVRTNTLGVPARPQRTMRVGQRQATDSSRSFQRPRTSIDGVSTF